MGDSTTSAGSAPVTLINVFEIPEDRVEEFVKGWSERAKLMSGKPGFRDTALHRALSSETRFQFVNISHWDSEDTYQTATADPQFQASAAMAQAIPNLAAHPALYRVVVQYDRPTL